MLLLLLMMMVMMMMMMIRRAVKCSVFFRIFGQKIPQLPFNTTQFE